MPSGIEPAIMIYLLITAALIIFTMADGISLIKNYIRTETASGSGQYRISGENHSFETLGVDSSRSGTQATSQNYFFRNSFYFKDTFAKAVEAVEAAANFVMRRIEGVSAGKYRPSSTNYVMETVGADSSRAPSFSSSSSYGFRNSFYYKQATAVVQAVADAFRLRISELNGGTAYSSASPNYKASYVSLGSVDSPAKISTSNFAIRGSVYS